jgi:hypothetical protein
VILKNEVGLSRLLVGRGHRPGTFFRPSLASYPRALLLRAGLRRGPGLLRCLSERRWPVNPSHAYWPLLLESGVPFIKVELLRDNPLRLDLKELGGIVRALNPRLWPLIQNHLARGQKAST